MAFNFKQWRGTIGGVVVGAGNILAAPDVDIQTGLLSLGLGVLGHLLDRQMKQNVALPPVVPEIPIPVPVKPKRKTKRG